MSNAVPESTPGTPWSALAKDNESLIDGYEDVVIEVLHDRLQRLAAARFGPKETRRQQIIRAGLADLVRLFVKQEPHKISKLDTGRYRLICAVSLPDSIIERVLYQARAKFEIAYWQSHPSKPGMGASDEALSSLRESLEEILKEGVLVDTDVSGWDWQQKWWMAYCSVFVAAILMEVKPTSVYMSLLMNREMVALFPVFSSSSGQLYELTSACIMLSGRFVTSFFNSMRRVFLASLAGTVAIAMGDDCCEGCTLDEVDAVKDSYATFGYPKGFIEYSTSDSIEEVVFCSCRYYGNTAEPVNWARMVFRLLSATQNHVAAFMQFAFEVRHLRALSGQRMAALLAHAQREEEGLALTPVRE